MAQQATLTSKGQVTIPLSVRQKLGVKPGDKLSFEDLAPDAFRLRRASRTIDTLIGCLGAYALPEKLGPADIELARQDEFAGRQDKA